MLSTYRSTLLCRKQTQKHLSFSVLLHQSRSKYTHSLTPPYRLQHAYRILHCIHGNVAVSPYQVPIDSKQFVCFCSTICILSLLFCPLTSNHRCRSRQIFGGAKDFCPNTIFGQISPQLAQIFQNLPVEN